MDMNLKIHRFVEGKKWVQDYKLTVKTGMTVLEALTEVKEKQDPTLSFTCSCRSSICGACAVRVNGNAELSCEVLVETLMKRYKTDTLVIEPLGNFKVIRDLVVDWDPKYATIKKIKPVIEPKKEFSLETGCKQSPEEFNKFKKYAKCILCGSCVSECNKSALNQEDFLSPFVFVKAERLVADSRNRSPQEQLKAIVSGVWNVAKGSVKTLAAIPTDIKNFIPDFNLSKSLPDINSQSGTLSAATDSFKNIFHGGFGTDFNIDEYAKKYTNEVPDQKTENTKTDNKAKKEADEAKIARQAREASGIINWDNYDNQKQAGL